jgi:hypothetical protein
MHTDLPKPLPLQKSKTTRGSVQDSLDRRGFLTRMAAGIWAAGLADSPWVAAVKHERNEAPVTTGFRTHKWEKHSGNPVLPPGEGPFDVGCCMNPFVLRQGDEYYLYYAGADKTGGRRICLAIAPVSDVTKWRRVGPLFERGGKGSFDELWDVLPCVHRIGGRWHLYFTGHSRRGGGLQAFYGMGLAVSDDLLHWEKYSPDFIMTGDGFPEWPDNKGIAGGGRIHVAESLAQVPFLYRPFPDGAGRTRLVRQPDGGVKQVELTEFTGCSKGYGKAEPVLREAGVVKDGHIGPAAAQLMRGSDILQVLVPLLRADPGRLLCDKPTCNHCVPRKAFLAGLRNGGDAAHAGQP